MTAQKLHRWNAVFLVVFIALHMATHVAGLWGIDAYNGTQKLMRLFYRNPLVEPVLLASSVLQIILGLRLVWRNFRRSMRTIWGRVQLISGVVFVYFLIEHLAAMVFARWVDGLNTNFFWPASVMNGAPFTWYFVPYYFLGVSALFIHLGCAVRIAMLRSAHRHMALVGFWGLAVFGIALAALIVLILLGVFYDIQLPDQWVEYLRQFVPGYTQ